MDTIKTDKEAIAFIYHSYNCAQRNVNGHGKMKKNHQLSRKLLDALGKPDDGKQIVLVTGSKGKGSTATFISSLLTKLGYRTGLFTSPHLLAFNERIQVDGKAISDWDFIRLANKVQPHVNDLLPLLAANEYLGPIAIHLAIALLYFQENQVDYIVLEIGKGGLFDDTNVVDNKWAVITPILGEHMDELGPDISHVITHKLGIIKRQTETTIIGKQHAEPRNMIRARLAQKSTTAFCYGADVNIHNVDITTNGATFDLTTRQSQYTKLACPLLGTYQYENIALAVQTCEIMTKNNIKSRDIRQWIENLENPGKCDVLHEQPFVIADAAIHRDSAKYLNKLFANRQLKNVTSIVGLSIDKDYKGVIDTISSFSDHMIISRPENSYKYFAGKQVADYATSRLPTAYMPSFSEAIALTMIRPAVDAVLIIGNHSFVAEAKQWFAEHSRAEQGKTLKTTT